MRTMDLMDAAQLVENSYMGRAHLPPVHLDISEGHVQASQLTDNTFVTSGTHEPVDYKQPA